jgi:hypothetical protein
MTEFNPAAEAERLAAQAAADLAKAGTTIEGDVEAIKTDLTGDAEKALAAKIALVAQGNKEALAAAAIKNTAAAAIRDSQAGVQQGFDAASAYAPHVDELATAAHGAVSVVITAIEAMPAELSGELKEAGLRLKSALSWIEAHFTTRKATPPAPAAAAPTPPAS